MREERLDDDRLRWERRARALLSRLAAISGSARGTEEALRAVLGEISAHTGWPAGHAFLPAEMHAAGDAARRALELARPVWIPHGGGAAFAVPAVAGDRVHAVLEFVSPEPQAPDDALLEVMAGAGALLGGILERGAADAALRRQELRFRAVVETASDAIVSVGGDGRVVAWNRAAEAMFGWSEAEMLGRPLGAIMPERFRAGHEAGLRRVAAGGERHVIGRTVELHGLRRDGSELPVELSLASSRLGEETFFTGIIRDISRRRADEEALRRAAQRLEESERRATEASRAKSVFLANMSHELRTPLNAILGFVQLMRRDAGLAADQQESLGIILSSGEHLLSLINDVLSIAKIEAGHVAVAESDFDLARLVDGLRELFVPRARTKQLTMLADTDDLPLVRGDEAKLRQVLINLVGNALKFTSSGGVALRARWGQGTARFEVEDSGRGIPAGELEAIFEPFVQGRAVDGGEGTGLGLALSRSFVRAMGGELEVRSTDGRGSCFAFTIPLPLAAGAPAAAPERRVVALAPGEPPRRVLVVDNDADNRRLLERLLGGVGFVVTTAADGAAGLAAALALRPDVVLMDMRMPVLDGYEATRRLRAGEAPGEHTVVIALTASAFEHDRPAILAAGCDEIIHKPFREATLLDTIARTIGVRYRFADEAPEAGAVAPAQLAALPAPLVAALRAALAGGDDLAAARACEQIAALAPAVGHELARRVRALELDELLALLEAVQP